MMDPRNFISLAALAVFAACASPEQVETTEPPPSSRQASVVDNAGDTTSPPAIPAEIRTVPFNENGPRYTWSITPAPKGTFGFSIYDRGQLYIHQLKATGLGGPDGWKSKMDARTAALEAMAKLENGEVPEGLTIVSEE